MLEAYNYEFSNFVVLFLKYKYKQMVELISKNKNNELYELYTLNTQTLSTTHTHTYIHT